MDRTSVYRQPWNAVNKEFTGRYFGFWLHCTVCGILAPRPGIEPMPPALEAQGLNHWITREVPRLGILALPLFRIKCIKYWHLVEPSGTNQWRRWGPVWQQGTTSSNGGSGISNCWPSRHCSESAHLLQSSRGQWERQGRGPRGSRGCSLSTASPGPYPRPRLLPRSRPRQAFITCTPSTSPAQLSLLRRSCVSTWVPDISIIAAVWSLSRVWLFCDPIGCSPPGSSVPGIS